MAQGNDNNNGAAIIGFIAAIAAFMAMFVFAIATFLTFVLTILSIMAWNAPLRVGKWTIQPDEARAFVRRGIYGAWLVPTFILFCEILFNVQFRWDIWPYYEIGGYVLGSFGVEYMMAQDEQSGDVSIYTPPPVDSLPPQRPQSHQPPSLPAQPFHYASWDDEDEQR